MHDEVAHMHRVYKRARSTDTETSAASTTTARGKGGRSSTSSTTAASTPGDTSFQPGAFATGTATRAAASGPPTNGAVSTLANSYYSSFSFAQQEPGLSRAAASASSAETSMTGVAGAPIAAASGTAGLSTEGTQLSTGALVGIIAGGSAAGVALLVVLGWCCWKRKKAKKVDAGWWSLEDDRSKRGTVKTSAIGIVPVAHKNGEWHGAGSFGGSSSSLSSPNGGYGGEKQDWARFDEKHRQYSESRSTAAIPIPHDLQAQREELFGPPSNSRTLTPSPPRATFAPPTSSSPPRAPFAQASPRPETGAYSVNDVISFSGAGPRSTSQYPPTSTVDSPRSNAPAASLPSRPSQPHSLASSAAHHHAYNGVSVGPQPILASAYPPQRPLRPSQVPSAAPDSPSPRHYVERAERPTSRDERVADRFMDVMTGKVGRGEFEPDPSARPPTQGGGRQVDDGLAPRNDLNVTVDGRNKKDTIIGLTDAYGGADWGDRVAI
ncbi:hypothetical protein JCM10212_001378 [Sporobolomyces blumeae]